jgi:DUF971 family protein
MRLENTAIMGNEIALAWSDGEESYLDFEMLRKACPCAACSGEPDVTGKVIVPKVVHSGKSYQLVRHQVVGGYAIQFFWGDGHSTGLYSFDLLRRLGA